MGQTQGPSGAAASWPAPPPPCSPHPPHPVPTSGLFACPPWGFAPAGLSVCDNRAPNPAISANYSNQHRGKGGGGGSGTHPGLYPVSEVPIMPLHSTLPLQVERACGEAGGRQPEPEHFPVTLAVTEGGGWGHPTSRRPRSPLPAPSGFFLPPEPENQDPLAPLILPLPPVGCLAARPQVSASRCAPSPETGGGISPRSASCSTL